MSPKQIFLQKFNMWIKKRTFSCWFQIRWKNWKKVHTKKVVNKNVTEICTLFTFTRVHQVCFACDFYGRIFFETSSTDFKSAFFDTFLTFSKSNFLVLFANFEAERARIGTNYQQTYFSFSLKSNMLCIVLCSIFNICTIGYNEFDFFFRKWRLQTLWWVQNWNLRHIY